MIIINTHVNHKILSAGRNIYLSPALHPNRKLNMHDIIYLIDGNWKIGFENNIYTMTKDDVLILPANIFHFGIKPCSPQTKTMYIHASCETNDGYITTNNAFNSDYSICLHPLINASENPYIKEIFVKVINSFNQGKSVKASAYFSLLLSELFECTHYINKNQMLAHEIQNMINNHLYQNFTNREIADKLHISTRTAETIFKSYFNTTIHQYTINKKIDVSKQYLLFFPEMKIIDIAASLGFYDEYHFSKIFKSKMQMSPTEYRKSALNTEYISCI